MQKLSTFGSAIAHKSLNVLLQTVYSIPHLFVPFLCRLQARFEVEKFLIYASIFGEDSGLLTRDCFILALFRADSLVLKETIEADGEVFHQ